MKSAAREFATGRLGRMRQAALPAEIGLMAVSTTRRRRFSGGTQCRNANCRERKTKPEKQRG
jgi:hypothetical protein